MKTSYIPLFRNRLRPFPPEKWDVLGKGEYMKRLVSHILNSSVKAYISYVILHVCEIRIIESHFTQSHSQNNWKQTSKLINLH
jgi:hypothetical protein